MKGELKCLKIIGCNLDLSKTGEPNSLETKSQKYKIKTCLLIRISERFSNEINHYDERTLVNLKVIENKTNEKDIFPVQGLKKINEFIEIKSLSAPSTA